MRYFEYLVAGTTAWSGLSYAYLKNAVTILGTNEELKAKQGARGRAIIGVLYGGVVLASVWLFFARKASAESIPREMNEHRRHDPVEEDDRVSDDDGLNPVNQHNARLRQQNRIEEQRRALAADQIRRGHEERMRQIRVGRNDASLEEEERRVRGLVETSIAHIEADTSLQDYQRQLMVLEVQHIERREATRRDNLMIEARRAALRARQQAARSPLPANQEIASSIRA